MKLVDKTYKEMDLYALFVYATLIVDLYRKFSSVVYALPIGVTMFRNIVYVTIFFAVLYYIVKNKRCYSKLLSWSIGFVIFTFISYSINYQNGIWKHYVDIVFMFVSRLLPALYIGYSIVGREEEFINSICKFRWLALAYIVLIIIHPEMSESSYMTLAYNLLIPVLACLFATGNYKFRIKNYIVAFWGVLIIVIYGGRASLVAVIFAIILRYIFYVLDNEKNRRFTSVSIVVIVLLFFVVLFLDILANVFTSSDSRTIRMIEQNDFLSVDSRNSYYTAAWESIVNNPFKVYGFLGDRLYFAESFGYGVDLDGAVSMVAHNVYFELMLTLGVIPGLILGLFFTMRIVGTFFIAKKNQSTYILYSALIGAMFPIMLVSDSYLSSIMIWMVFGWMSMHDRMKKSLCNTMS